MNIYCLKFVFFYNTIINSKVEPKNYKNRTFTSLDMYPTILASLGVEIEGNQLGLGVNLFSNKKRVSCNKIFYVIDSIVQVFGINNIGIGSDFFGTKKLPYNLKGYDDMQNLFKCFKMYGYNENDISKIMCDNFIDFVKRQKSICNS